MRGDSAEMDVSQMREIKEHDKYMARVTSQLVAQVDTDEDLLREQSRKRRQGILEKYQGKKSRIAEKDDVVEHSGLGCQTEQVSPQESLPSFEDNDDLPIVATSEMLGDIFEDEDLETSPCRDCQIGYHDKGASKTRFLSSNWDDADGYYSFRAGEILNGCYKIESFQGRGVFSTVVRAQVLRGPTFVEELGPEFVAIKIIRNNEMMRRLAHNELAVLTKLAGADPDDKRHCLRMISRFEYRSHLCLVFESLHMNLREILRKFGRNIGINLGAVRTYATHLFTALEHLTACQILHCDIKLDNILVNESKTVLKLCDFGSSMFAGENEMTPYLVSRFYRAPEIMLGLPYDHALDMWAVGCCLYELYTGRVLFPGRTNNHMLRLHMELKGPFPKKMLKRAMFADEHFDKNFTFFADEDHPVTQKPIRRALIIKPRDTSILASCSAAINEDARMFSNFNDLLAKMLILDPDKRLTVSQALVHPFISQNKIVDSSPMVT